MLPRSSITGSTNDTLQFYGKGAGSIPTATAIVSDLVSIIEKRSYIDFKNENKLVVNKNKVNENKYFIIDLTNKKEFRTNVTDEQLQTSKFYARVID